MVELRKLIGTIHPDHPEKNIIIFFIFLGNNFKIFSVRIICKRIVKKPYQTLFIKCKETSNLVINQLFYFLL